MSRLVSLLVLFCALLFGLVVAVGRPNPSRFHEWMAKHRKTYHSDEHYVRALKNFENSEQVIKQLRESNPEATFDLNEFADLSFEEFKAKFANSAVTPALRNSLLPSQSQHKLASPRTPPMAFDWRSKNAVSPVAMQGGCGSCYAFATAENLESLWFLHGHTSKVFQLSKQQIVDCAGGGCAGLDAREAYQYVARAGGLESEADYNYTSQGGQAGVCHPDPSRFAITGVQGFANAIPDCLDHPESCGQQDEELLRQRLVDLGPFAIAVAVLPSWQHYSGGIISNCTFDPYQLNHWVQMTGYDWNQGQMYWSFKNSWNTTWGEAGYMRMRAKQNTCGIADLPIYGILN